MNIGIESADGSETDRELTGRELFTILSRRRWWILASALVACALCVGASYFFVPVYRASTVLVPAESERAAIGGLASSLSQFGGLASLAGIDLANNSTATEEALAILRSRAFTEKFLAEEAALPVLYSSRRSPDGRSWRTDEVPSYAEASRLFDKKIRKVVQDKKTGLITVQIDWRDPTVAATWANGIVKSLNENLRQRALSSAAASIEHLEKELGRTNVLATQEAISRLMAAQVNRRMLANVTEEYAFRILDRALPPDPKQPVWPNRPLFALMGLAFGLVLGIGLAVAIATKKRQLRRA